MLAKTVVIFLFTVIIIVNTSLYGSLKCFKHLFFFFPLIDTTFPNIILRNTWYTEQ